jgi:hypothetical protein
MESMSKVVVQLPEVNVSIEVCCHPRHVGNNNTQNSESHQYRLYKCENHRQLTKDLFMQVEESESCGIHGYTALYERYQPRLLSDDYTTLT